MKNQPSSTDREEPFIEQEPEYEELDFPRLARQGVSGLYSSTSFLSPFPFSATQAEQEETMAPASIGRYKVFEELRLDVDGPYPLHTVSGTIKVDLGTQVHWIANLRGSHNDWMGHIWYTYPTRFPALNPFTEVRLEIQPSIYPHQRRVKVTFSGEHTRGWARTFEFRSPYFHSVQFEFDCAEGTSAVTSMETHAHPNRPATLADETLTIDKVYRRAGFSVTHSAGEDNVPLALAGAGGTWSDSEMHDAMQVYWSRFADKAQWSMWVFFAALHELNYGGIMFDDIGPNHRQGTAVFEDSFIADAPPGDPNPAAWVQRSRFWCACHEMGHAFNLAHSWQKSLTVPGRPWIRLPDEPEARSFMNYPYRVLGGESAYFSDFEFRFSDSELLFLRHAPTRFVQMGNAAWFDHHGFEQANVLPTPNFKLELRTNRPRALFEFMEPPMFELKLTNVSGEPRMVPEKLFLNRARMSVILKKDRAPARQFVPYAQYFFRDVNRVLAPNKSLYEPLAPHAGLNGMDLCEPGNYTIQVALHLASEDVVSNPLRIRVAPPRSYEEEVLAQDFFMDDVGRVLALRGSRFLESANDTLREVVEVLPKNRVAIHAGLALGAPKSRDYKLLSLPEGMIPMESVHQAGGRIKVLSAEAAPARKELAAALLDQAETAAETLGHIFFKESVDRYSDLLGEQGEKSEAARVQDQLFHTLSERNVIAGILHGIEQRRDELAHAA